MEQLELNLEPATISDQFELDLKPTLDFVEGEDINGK